MSAIGKLQRRTRRKSSIRRKVRGSAECPRITVFRSLKHIYAQAIDDVSGRTLAQASTLNDEGVDNDGRTVASGTAVGKAIAERLKQQGIERGVFDRNGYLYHGRVKAVAEGAREAGLNM